MSLRQPYLMFLGDCRDQLAAKTAQGVADWRPDLCLGQLRLEGCNADLGLADMSLAQGREAGAETLIIGVANAGGIIPDSWTDVLVQAIEQGYDLASGLHTRLGEVPRIKAAAKANGRALHDVRHSDRTFAVGSGAKRPGKRVLTVGTDCSVGKMYTSLALEREMKARGMKVSFRATGQTGIFIVGDGVSVDAVVSDFISGATEWLCPANDEDHWDSVEGQGSLFHASFAGVSMGLLHGAQADALVLCHEPTRTHMRGLPHYPLPDLADCIAANEAAARLTNPAARCIGVAVNTKSLGPDEADSCLKDISDRLGMPAVDPVRTGVGPLVDRLN